MGPEEAKLVLEDGSVFSGLSFGAPKSVSGEVVFNTGMVGYPESLTDPSYWGQLLVLTYPLVGNYGVPGTEKDSFGIEANFESSGIKVSGLVVSDYSFEHSHWQAKESLGEWLQREGIPAITGIDTRALTKRLREKGVMLGKIVFGDAELGFSDPNERNLASEVSCPEPIVFGTGKPVFAMPDLGAKNSIVRALLKRGCSVIKFPWNYDIFNGRFEFDAVFASNGPGDPKKCAETAGTLAKSMEYGFPTFGICFGNQLLALAAGADTFKLKYGHRSQNQPCLAVGSSRSSVFEPSVRAGSQPCLAVGSRRCYITSQNHGYAVDEKTLPKEWKAWFRNLNDQTNEGIMHESKPFMSVQFHPEASPGPLDTAFLFDEFVKLAKGAKK